MSIKIPPAEFIKNSYCSYCCVKFLEQVAWPRKCFICWNISYINPIPVVVALIPIKDKKWTGLLIQRRNIDPGKDGWAHLSGFIDNKETWQQAVVREAKEEIGLESTIDQYVLLEVVNSTDSDHMLIVCQRRNVLSGLDDLNFVPNEEVSAVAVSHFDTKLIFPTHQKISQRFFSEVASRGYF